MGVREENRERMESAILDTGRRHLAEVGPAQLSLRAIAREIDVSSSAVYRYVASRDDLLTRLIVTAYDDVGAAVEAAATPSGTPIRRWRRATDALRAWALDHPNEWALLYGSPVPGYVAPEETVTPAGRVARVLAEIVGDTRPAAAPRRPGGRLRAQLDATADAIGLAADPDRTVLLVSAWSQLVGTLGLELGGHYFGTVDPTGHYWSWLVDDTAHRLGLR